MSKLKYLLLFIVIPFLRMENVDAQVSGISYTLSPVGEYAWFDENSGLSDGFLLGGQLGFGFGQNVELAATYMQGLNFTTAEDRFGALNWPAGLATRDVDFRRYGGEIKLNLSRTALKPYIAVGTGVQDVRYAEGEYSSQIYTTGGLGIKLTAADRYTLAIQGNTNYYNFNAVNTLLSPEDIAEYGINRASFGDELNQHYSLRGSLLFYIGGRNPDEISDIDEAYWDNFSQGFRGLSMPIQPTVMKVNFHESLPYRDAYFAGGSLGFDFGPLVGIRGFYYQALEDDSYSKFDKLAMYGGEAKFKLNEGRGFVPSLIIGGGNIDARNSYVSVDSTTNVGDEAFASGGFGIDIPFSKYFKASGFAKALLTSGTKDVDDLYQPTDINTSWAYGVSLNFILGRKTKDIDVMKRSTFDEYATEQEQEYQRAINSMRDDYSYKVDSLERRLAKAKEENDAREVARIEDEKRSAEKIVDRLDDEGERNSERYDSRRESREERWIEQEIEVIDRRPESHIMMTPAEFQLILRDVLDARRDEMNMMRDMRRKSAGDAGESQSSAIEKLRDDLESQRAMDMVHGELSGMQEKLSAVNEKMEELKAENAALKKEKEDMVASQQREKEVQMLLGEIERNRDAMYDMKKSQAMKLEGIEDEQTREAVASYTTAMEKSLNDANDRIIELSKALAEANKKTEVKVVVEEEKPYKDMGVDDEIYVVEEKSNNRMSVKTRRYDNEKKGFFNKLRYEGMSGFVGFGVGGTSTFNLGYRLHYSLVNNKNVEFMPETFFGLGSPSSFGLSANGLYKFNGMNLGTNVTPYVGAGLGLLKVGDDENEDQIKGAFNLMIGTSLNVWKGDLYVDFTTRNLGKYNQIIAGYRFPF